MSIIEIAYENHTRVYNKLYNSNPRFISGKPGINPEVWLTSHGKQYAVKLKAKIDLAFKHHLIIV